MTTIKKVTDYDEQFSRESENFLEALKNEYDPRISEAADVGYVLNQILEELRVRKWNLHTHSKLIGHQLGNYFKHALIKKMDHAFKVSRSAPVSYLFKNLLPNIRDEFRQKQEDIPGQYVNNFPDGTDDSDFINATDEQIIYLIAHSFAIDNYDAHINGLMEDYQSEEFKIPNEETTSLNSAVAHSENDSSMKKPKTTENSEKIENAFCKSMPVTVPKEHFKVFVEQKSKNGNPFLTQEQFDSFIKKAFLGRNDIEKLIFNYSHGEKLFIVKRFYEFFSSVSGDYENTTQCREKYINLLVNNFSNWEYGNIKNNFGNKVRKKW